MQTVGHIAVNGIIYRKSDPAHIFADIKDQTYPHIVWRRCLCLIGGNWTGKGAAHDVGPCWTFAREVYEELSLEKNIQSTAELGETSVHDNSINYIVQGLNQAATLEDEMDLHLVKQAIIDCAQRFDDYVVTIPREVFLRGDSSTRQTDITALCCVLDVGLNEEVWQKLVRLQHTLGNLSCESESHVLSIGGMIRDNLLAMSGQDYFLQEFFETKGVMYSRTLPRDPAVCVQRAAIHPRECYEEYLTHYNIIRKPEGW